MTLTTDGKLSADVQAENFLAWEIFRVFYHACAGVTKDASWPEPAGSSGFDPGSILDNPAVKALLDKFLPAVPALTLK